MSEIGLRKISNDLVMNSDSMHILLIPSWYKTPQKPHRGTFFEEQARMLQRKGHQVGVFYPRHHMQIGKNRTKRFEEQPKDWMDNGIPTWYSFSSSILPRSNRFNYYMASRKAAKKFRQYIDAFGKPDLLHAHATFAGGIIANYLSEKFSIPFVLTEHFTGMIDRPENSQMAEKRNPIQRVFATSQRNMIVSSYFKDALLKTYSLDGEKMEVVPNIVNPLFFENRVPKKSGHPFQFLVIGFLNARKNHSLLFEALAEVKKTHSDIQLRIAGDGALRKKLEAETVEKGIQGNVHFLGNIDRNAIKSEVDACHVVVSSSDLETFGVSLIEGLAAGRPVIATDSGGPRDIVTKKDGLLIPQQNPKALSEAMLKMIDTYDQYDQDTISKSCMDRFSEEAVCEQIVSIYKKVAYAAS